MDGMDPKYLREYSSEKSFVLYEAGSYIALYGGAVVFRAMAPYIHGQQID